MDYRIKLTSAQREAVRYKENLSLVSCPGSGKTRTIVAKLLNCLNEVTESTRLIGCITYTNAAVDEIVRRVSKSIGRDALEDNFDIGTIHSFCLSNIFRPYHWKLTNFEYGFTILPPEDETYHQLVNDLISKYSLDNQAFDDFGLLNRVTKLPYRIPQQAATDFWNYLDSHSFVDFNGIIYYSSLIIKQFPFISSGLASKFAWILVDEFQDTSEYQVDILKAIASFGRTKFFIVGDPYQSIMSFAGGRPDLMDEFTREVGSRSDLRLSGNFRSSQIIINYAERLLPRKPAMQSFSEDKYLGLKPRWIHTSDVFDEIEEQFIPALQQNNINIGKCAILAPNIFQFFPLSPRLRNAGIPIIGPGARPYKRSNHLIAPLAEEVCSYTETMDTQMVKVIRRRLSELIINLEGKINQTFFSYQGDIAILEIIIIAKKLKSESDSALSFLENFSSEVENILAKRSFVSESNRKLISNSGFEIVEDIKKNHKKRNFDISNLSVADLGLFGYRSESLRLLTMHKAKGREFEGVLIINAQDGLIPYKDPPAGSDEEEEARRLFYVAITRAKKFLMIITNSSDWRNPYPSRFLYEIFPNGPECL